MKSKIKYPHQFDYYKNVAGKFCLIVKCGDCGRFVHDRKFEQLYCRAKWGESLQCNNRLVSITYRNGHHIYAGLSNTTCEECLIRSNSFVPLYQCLCCGKLGSNRKVPDREHSSMYDFYEGDCGRTRVCSKCWNKMRKVMDSFAEYSETKRFINRLLKTNKEKQHDA